MAEEVIYKDVISLPVSSLSTNEEEEDKASNSSSLPSSLMVDDLSEKGRSPSVGSDKQTKKDTSPFLVPPSLTIDEQVEKDVILSSLTPDRSKTERPKMRRNSSGNREEKPIPAYMRASTGSCHDYCKYGKLHTFAQQEKRYPIRRHTMVNTEPSGIIGVDIKMMNSREGRTKSEIKIEATKSQVNSKSLPEKQKTVTKKVVSHLKKPKFIESPQISSKLKTTAMKASPSPRNSSGSVNSGRNSSSNGSANLINSRRTSYESSENSTRGARSQKIRPSNSLQAVSDKRKSGTTLEKSPDFSDGLISPLGGSNSRRYSGISSLQGSRCLRNANPISRKGNECNLSNISESSNGCRNDILVKKTALSNVGVKKLLKPSLASMSPHPSSNASGRIKPLKNGNVKTSSPGFKQKKVPKSKPKDDKVSIKTIHMIEAKPKESKMQSSRSSVASSLSVSSFPSITAHDEEEHVDTESMLSAADGLELEEEVAKAKSSNGITKDEAKSRSRRSTSIHTEDRGGVPRKLSFRRGKVINLHSDNGGPRRLRFRQGRVVGENQVKVDVGRKSFRRKKELGGAASDKANSLGETVVLRHQNVQGKKEEQTLFNDVIEETANKLVETRKSKVKALVGAFETVISLQESKPVIAT